MQYEDAARAAYLGCINANGPSLSQLLDRFGNTPEFIPGLQEAHAFMEAELEDWQRSTKTKQPDEPIPPAIQDILKPLPKQKQGNRRQTKLLAAARKKPTPKSKSVPLDPEARRNLQALLTAAIHAKKAERMRQDAKSDHDKYILTVTHNETSADFLNVSIMDRRNLIPHFVMHVRRYLGLPITDLICNIGTCNKAPVEPNGDHCHHVQNAATKRHTSMKMMLAHMFQEFFESGQSVCSRTIERSLDELGFVRKEGKPQKHSDISLENHETGHKFVLDIEITHPKFDDENVRSEPLKQATREALAKIHTYTSCYEINEHDAIPIVFETYGGYAPKTLDFFKRISNTFAAGDEILNGQIMRHFRDRIAVTLCQGHGNVIVELNALNYLGVRRFR